MSGCVPSPGVKEKNSMPRIDDMKVPGKNRNVKTEIALIEALSP